MHINPASANVRHRLFRAAFFLATSFPPPLPRSRPLSRSLYSCAAPKRSTRTASTNTTRSSSSTRSTRLSAATLASIGSATPCTSAVNRAVLPRPESKTVVSTAAMPRARTTRDGKKTTRSVCAGETQSRLYDFSPFSMLTFRTPQVPLSSYSVFSVVCFRRLSFWVVARRSSAPRGGFGPIVVSLHWLFLSRSASPVLGPCSLLLGFLAFAFLLDWKASALSVIAAFSAAKSPDHFSAF